jgi:hypothetical protein
MSLVGLAIFLSREDISFASFCFVLFLIAIFLKNILDLSNLLSSQIIYNILGLEVM